MLLRPLPLTATEVAFALVQVIVVEPGAVAVVGDAVIEAVTEAAAVTETLADCVTGPPFPWAVMVNVCVPTGSPETDCVPLGAVLVSPGPLTATEVALALIHVTETVPGAVVLDGEVLIEADTPAGAATETV